MIGFYSKEFFGNLMVPCTAEPNLAPKQYKECTNGKIQSKNETSGPGSDS